MSDETTPPPGAAEEAIETADNKVVPLRQVARKGGKQEQVLQQAAAYVQAFHSIESTVKAAATRFRVAVHVEAKECRDVIEALQTLRRETAACLDFIEGERGDISTPLYAYGLSPLVSLQHLDGEQTARLILTLDAFKDLLLFQKEKTNERITMHVRLQNDLAREVREIAELVEKLEEMVTKVRAYPRQGGCG